MNNGTSHIAFFMASLGDGGIGKMRTHLTRELVERGFNIDLLLGEKESPYLSALHPGIKVVDLGTSNALTSLPRLVLYLRRAKPALLVTERIRVNVAAIRARRLSRVQTRVFAGVHTAMSQELRHMRPEKKRNQFAAMQHYYPQNDGFIAVSKGVAQDLEILLGIPSDKIHVIYNPVVTSELVYQSAKPLEHPWFNPKEIPVILGAGRLEPQKDFSTLIRAFALLRRYQKCRLIILGEGNQKQQLQDLVKELGIRKDVSLPGFVDNPYPVMANADVFVLSSVWEGLGNVLIEALALGTPVVSTDCKSGPREILQNGRYGCLVPVGDPTTLAEAIKSVLSSTKGYEILPSAVKPFTVETCADKYIQILKTSNTP